MEEKSKPPWPSLVGCPRLMSVEEKHVKKNLNETFWRTSSWRVLGHQRYQRKSPIFCMVHKDVGKTLVLCLTVLTWSPLAKVLLSDWSTWLMFAISCLENQATLPLHDHICNHDCTTSWNLTLRGYRRRKSLKASKTFIQQCTRQLLSSWGGSRKCKCILLVPLCHSWLLQEERKAQGKTWCPFPASLVMIPFWNIMELDDDEIPRFSWVINCRWSASWVMRSNILHSWRWRQQNLPLHVLDSAMHHRDERTEVKMFSFFFCLLFMVMGELASPESVCVAQCTLFILWCPMFARFPLLCLAFVICLPVFLIWCCILPGVFLVFFPFHGWTGT